MLAWPVFALIKHHCPEAVISALVPAYTSAMAEICPWIDEIVVTPVNASGRVNISRLHKLISSGHYDAVLTLFSTLPVALAACVAGVSYRLAPATKLSQFCYNHRLVQRRSRSIKPEYAYNLDLAYQLLLDFGGIDARPPDTPESGQDYLPEKIQRPLLQFPHEEIEVLQQSYFAANQIQPDSLLIFIHPGSGGSANNLRIAQYAELANRLTSTKPLCFVITAGPGEEDAARALQAKITNNQALVLQPKGGLKELSQYLALADLFISGSTGPMHIAAAMNCSTATFYPRHRSGSPLRWQGLNAPDKRLVFTPPEGADEKDVSSIDVEKAASEISSKFLQH